MHVVLLQEIMFSWSAFGAGVENFGLLDVIYGLVLGVEGSRLRV